jgi:hypothetical protein
LFKIIHNSSRISSDFTAIIIDIIAEKRLSINEKMPGEAKVATIQTTARLDDIAERTFIWGPVMINIKKLYQCFGI